MTSRSCRIRTPPPRTPNRRTCTREGGIIVKSCSPEVAIVVDPEFGERLDALATKQPVWVAGSATNRAAAERLWREPAPYVVTTFLYDATAPRAQVLAEILPVVDEHHGERSCDPPYRRLAVYGVRPNGAARAALSVIGFEFDAVTVDGFTAIVAGAT
jgi:hypothetical protein